MKPKNRRIFVILILIILSATGLIFTLFAFQKYVSFYQTPTQVLSQKPLFPTQKKWRMGGYVTPHSIQHQSDGLLSFQIFDQNYTITVYYKGLLPQLFRDKQGVVLDGYFQGDIFIATRVLAKHDEVYTSRARSLQSKPRNQ